MKAKYTIAATGAVILSYNDENDGERIERVFSCPAAGGYVREGIGDPRQVCEKLSSRGVALRAQGDGEALAAVIRREYNAKRRADRKHLAS